MYRRSESKENGIDGRKLHADFLVIVVVHWSYANTLTHKSTYAGIRSRARKVSHDQKKYLEFCRIRPEKRGFSGY